MDTLLDEDWTEFNNQYRFNLDGCADNGEPGTYVSRRNHPNSDIAPLRNYTKAYRIL